MTWVLTWLACAVPPENVVPPGCTACGLGEICVVRVGVTACVPPPPACVGWTANHRCGEPFEESCGWDLCATDPGDSRPPDTGGRVGQEVEDRPVATCADVAENVVFVVTCPRP